MVRWMELAALAVLLLTPSSAFPWPEDTALLVTSSTVEPPAASTTALPTLPSAQTAERAPTPPPEVRSLHVNSEVQYRYAHTVVSSRVANPANLSQEVTFSVVLPETAFISSFVMEVDGKKYRAYVKEKQEAKKTYDAAVAAGQSAAHVAVSARDSNSFTVSLNVEPRDKVSFNLTYEELLSRRLGQYQHVVTLNPGQVVNDLQVRVHIKENKKINKLRVPEFSSGNKIESNIQDCDEVTPPKSGKCTSGNKMATITWNTPNDVEVVFRPSEEQQREIVSKLEMKKEAENLKNAGYRTEMRSLSAVPVDSRSDKSKDSGLNGQFSVEYDVDRSADGGEVVVNDGYFVHFFSPTELKPLKKHAIFVLDVSGSMDGRKIEQLREAMLTILDDLKDGDYFNLIAFSTDVKVWNLDRPDKSAMYRHVEGYFRSETTTVETPTERPPAYRATKDNIDKAKDIVRQMSAYGGTNINEALKTALDCARDGAPTDGAELERIILFLTDGDPTVGLTVPNKITAGISELNLRPRSAIFSLAFGDGADIKFLRKLSLANRGFARTIYEAADASAQLKDFYREISSPLLANVTFEYIPEKVERDSMTQLNFGTFFDGTELVVAGRTANKGIQDVGGDVKAVADGSKHATYTPHMVGVDEPLTIYPFDAEGPLFNHTQAPRQASVLERLWAYLTIKQLLDQQDALDAVSGDEEIFQETRVGLGLPPTPSPPLALPGGQIVAVPTFPTGVSNTEKSADTNAGDALDLSVLNPKPKQKALELALKYSFVTPLTSLVVVKPNETKATDAQPVNPSDSSNPATLQALQLSGSRRSRLHSGVSRTQVDGHFQPSWDKRKARVYGGDVTASGVAHSLPSVLGEVANGRLNRFGGYGAFASSLSAAPPALPSQPLYGLSGLQLLSMPSLSMASMAGGPRPGPLLSLDSTPNQRPPPPPWAAGASTGLHVLATEEREPVSHSLAASTTTTSPPVAPQIANISDVKWLPKDALQKGSVVLPLNVNGTEKSYKISNNETDPQPPQSCQITGDMPSVGACRHFSNCVLEKVVERIEDFKNYQCAIGEYLAICCPYEVHP